MNNYSILILYILLFVQQSCRLLLSALFWIDLFVCEFIGNKGLQTDDNMVENMVSEHVKIDRSYFAVIRIPTGSLRHIKPSSR